MVAFALGFRPFFLGAGLYAAVAMGAWALAWRGTPLPGTDLFGPTMWWHAHTLIHGFAFAAIIGFLLTAARNWTGTPTLRGPGLAALFALWIAARLLPHLGAALPLVASVDLVFQVGALVAVTVPLVRARRWRDVGIFSTKLLTLTIGNALVYFAPDARRAALYLGLYLVLALIMTIGKRVFPMFIEKGLGGQVKVDRAPWLARVNLIAFVAYVIADLGWPQGIVSAGLAALVAAVNARRLVLWSRPGVWRKPMLWVLIAGYASIVIGFALRAASAGWPGLASSATHAWTAGGIGLCVLGMMVRVTLGHTGRNVRTPQPGWLVMMFGALLIAASLRVAAPLLAPAVPYTASILCAQALWTLAFLMFGLRYTPMLLTPRADGKPG